MDNVSPMTPWASPDDEGPASRPPWYLESLEYRIALSRVAKLLPELPPEECRNVDPGVVFEKLKAAAIHTSSHINPGADPRVMLYLRSVMTPNEITFVLWYMDRSVAEPDPLSQVCDLATLLAEPDPEEEWTVDRMLPDGGTSLIVGPPKVGKTTAAECLAVAVAQGSEWLGRECVAGPVVYLSFEADRHRVKRNLLTLGATADDPIFCRIDAAPRDGMALLAGVVEEWQPRLVLVDTLAKLVRLDDVNDYAKASAVLEPVSAIARDSRTHIAFLHHSRKAEGEYGTEALGSAALFGGVDTLVSIRRDAAVRTVRTVETVQRYGDDLARSVLDLDTVSGWVGIGSTVAGRMARDTEEAILALLETEAPATLNTSRIVKEVTGARNKILGALHRLTADGLIERHGTGVGRDAFVYTTATGTARTARTATGV